MSSAWTLLLASALAGQPVEAPSPQDTTTIEPARVQVPTSAEQLREQALAAIRQARAAQGYAATRQAAEALLRAYFTLDESTQLRSREQGRLKTMLRSRMRRTSEALVEELARQRTRTRVAERKARVALASTTSSTASVEDHAPASASAGVLAGWRAGGRAEEDYGQQLVELIQTVIQPDQWEVNGGRSTIYYYKPRHALIISAPAEVHHAVGGALGGLRAVP